MPLGISAPPGQWGRRWDPVPVVMGIYTAPSGPVTSSIYKDFMHAYVHFIFTYVYRLSFFMALVALHCLFEVLCVCLCCQEFR